MPKPPLPKSNEAVARSWDIRGLTPSDGELLRTATLANVNWAGERVTYRDIDADAALRHYCSLDPMRGDFGFVGVDDVVIGVVWLLFLNSADPGYGFVDDGVPELSVSVWSGYRGRGIGRALINHALAQAALQGVARVSLSVEDGNPAVNLYRNLGFVRQSGAAEGTYVISLDSGRGERQRDMRGSRPSSGTQPRKSTSSVSGS